MSTEEAMKLALEKFANVKSLCDKHGDKINRKHVYGGALIEHFDVVCQALAEQPAQQPAQRKPLRGERFVEIARAIAPRTVLGLQETIPVWIVKYGRAIEAAHGIKENT